MLAEHEKLEVYHRSAALAAELDQVARSIPGIRRDARDQLRRASLSVPLNIAEGAGEHSPAAKARHYRIARASTTECMSILDVLRRVEKTERFTSVMDELRKLSVMLTALALTCERRAAEEAASGAPAPWPAPAPP